MKSQSPGKLIISGEHAVVHGAPAIAMAVDRYAYAEVAHHGHGNISFNMNNLRYQQSHTLQALKDLKHRLQDDYQKFLRGEVGIRDVLKKPFELSQFAASRFVEALHHKMNKGVQLDTHSDIPIGCGMGSSAAMILCVIHAMAQHMQLELNEDQYLSYAIEAENLQHGYSSGLDLQVSLKGGCLYFQNGTPFVRPLPTSNIYMVNTGEPESSTGECVAQVKTFFTRENLTKDFSDITNHIDTAIQDNQPAELYHGIKENHKLLSHIGVVPEKIQKFIDELEAVDAAAKTCGAGAIAGDNGGIVLIFSEDKAALEKITQKYGYQIENIKGEALGLRAA